MLMDTHRLPVERDQGARASSRPSSRARLIAWVVLLVSAAIGWAVTIFQTRSMSDMGGMPGMPPMPSPALLFLSVWVAMMVAMMFPSIAPMVAVFTTVSHNRRQAGRRAAPTWVFLLGYLTIWSIFGAGAYLLSLIVPEVGMTAPGLRAYNPVIGGLTLIFAGFYQWSPLKRVCLEHCRSPLGFLTQEWRDGIGGAFRLGIAHGGHCVGCCWGLMLVLFAVGLMNLSWMVLLAAVIFAEKVVPHGPLVGKVAGVAILMSGGAILAAPWLSRFPAL